MVPDKVGGGSTQAKLCGYGAKGSKTLRAHSSEPSCAEVVAHPSTADRMNPLEVQREQVAQQLQELRRQEQRAKRNQRKAVNRGRPLTSARLSQAHCRQLLRMLYIAELDIDATVTCISHAAHPPPWSGWDHAQRRELLEGVMAQRTVVEVAAWADPANAANRRALLYLWNLWAEYRAAEWVQETNRTRGVAPSSERVLAEVRAHLRTAPAALRHHLLRGRSINAKRKWMQRWRKTWRGSMGTLAVGEVDEPAVLQNKDFSNLYWP